VGRTLRTGGPARLGRTPTRPKTRIKNTGDDVYLLLRYVRTYLRVLWQGPQVQALRQIFLQNYWVDERARVRWREPDEAGLPSSSTAIVSPYDLTARYSRRNDIRWKGFLAHVTETCDDDMVNIITDVTTTPATLYDIRALPAIHDRLAQRDLLPDEHLVDGGYTSVVQQDQSAREHGITLVGPVRKKRTRQSRQGNVFDRDAFTIDWERQQVVCPQGKPSREWSAPLSITPYTRVRFAKEDCGQCPVKSSCTRGDRRQLNFLPQQLARTADCRPSRPADHSLEGELRDARRHREHRQRPRHATNPLPESDQDPRPARPHRHRRQHRARQHRIRRPNG
jgi:hypothetical protein